jgi:DHA1 family inner membrane transport protein
MRFLAGLPHGGYLGVAMLYAADTMPREQRARGVTRIMMGLTFANIIGVPLVGWMGQALGWRLGFAVPGLLALASAALIQRLAPRVAADPLARPMEELRALGNPSVILTLLVGAIGFGGLFAVYSYLSAAMLATAAPPVWAVPAALSLFGIGATLGSIGAARLTIRLGTFRAALALILFMAATQGLAALAVGSWPLMALSALVLGLGSGMVVPLQTRLMDIAGRAQSMASAMNHAAFNAANALGPWLAGMALAAGWGWRSPGLVGIALSAAPPCRRSRAGHRPEQCPAAARAHPR